MKAFSEMGVITRFALSYVSLLLVAFVVDVLYVKFGIRSHAIEILILIAFGFVFIAVGTLSVESENGSLITALAKGLAAGVLAAIIGCLPFVWLLSWFHLGIGGKL